MLILCIGLASQRHDCCAENKIHKIKNWYVLISRLLPLRYTIDKTYSLVLASKEEPMV